MAFDVLRLIIRVIPTVASLGSMLLLQTLRSFYHRHIYRAVQNPKIIVVIGGSFTGTQATMRLSQTLPTGYRVVIPIIPDTLISILGLFLELSHCFRNVLRVQNRFII